MNLSELTIKEVKSRIKEMDQIDQDIIEELALDSRKGVQRIAQSILKKQARAEADRQKFEDMSIHEERLRSEGYNLICGIDEAGRGPLAGPVVVGAVILDQDTYIRGLDDSKKLSEKKREELFEIIQEESIAVGVGIVNNQRIDQINILQATYKAMRQAVQDLDCKPDYLLVDAETIPNINIPQAGIVEGDSHSISIAAGSIIAKVTRDRMMLDYHLEYPEYNFASHKGYGTQEHIQALEKHGVTPIHRFSFKIVKETLTR